MGFIYRATNKFIKTFIKIFYNMKTYFSQKSKRRVFSLLLCVILILNIFIVANYKGETTIIPWPLDSWSYYLGNSFDGGNGAKDSPYEIKTGEQLAFLSQKVNAGERDANGLLYNECYYKMTSNIDLSSHMWVPIGINKEYSFKGNFNGAGYKVFGLYINDPNLEYAGLFGVNENGIIKTVNIESGAIYLDCNGDAFVGAIAGYNYSDEARLALYKKEGIEKEVNNEVTIEIIKTLIAGESSYTGSEIIGCSSNIKLLGRSTQGNTYVGGITGYNSNSRVIGSYTNEQGGIEAVSQSAGAYAGGIVGYNYRNNNILNDEAEYGSIKGCYSLSNVSSMGIIEHEVGGICGKNNGKLKSCYYDQTKYMASSVYGLLSNDQGLYSNSNETSSNDEIKGKGVDSSEIKIDHTVDLMNLESIGSGVFYSLNSQNEVLTKELDGNWTDSDLYTIRPEGEGKQNNPYLLESAENLAWVAKYMSGYSGTYYKQTADIDISAHFWVPFALVNCTYDGGGYTIRRLTISQDHQNNGLFSSIIDSTIKNVSITNSGISYEAIGTTHAGGIGGSYSNSTILNSTSDVYINIIGAANSYAGGIVGSNMLAEPSQITNCKSNSSIVVEGGSSLNGDVCIGGIAGNINGDFINGCYYNCTLLNATVTTDATGDFSAYNSAYLGGIVGMGYGQIQNCEAYLGGANDTITASSASGGGAYAGGIIGYIPTLSSYMSVINCYVAPYMIQSICEKYNGSYIDRGAFTGGIVGRYGTNQGGGSRPPLQIFGCTLDSKTYEGRYMSAYNKQDSYSRLGGIIGLSYSNIEIQGCNVSPRFGADSGGTSAQGEPYSGGIAGELNSNSNILACYVSPISSSIEVQSSNFGAICGKAYNSNFDNKNKIYSCYVTGPIKDSGGTLDKNSPILFSGINVDIKGCYYNNEGQNKITGGFYSGGDTSVSVTNCREVDDEYLKSEMQLSDLNYTLQGLGSNYIFAMDSSTKPTNNGYPIVGWPVTVTFDSNGGDAAPQPIQVFYGKEYNELPVLTRLGYRFIGWYSSAVGGDKIESTTKVTMNSNHVLYAYWEPDVFTVEYYINEPTDQEVCSGSMETNKLTYGVGGSLSLNQFSIVGYKFVGWATSSNSNTVKYNDGAKIIFNNQTETPNKNDMVKLYAVWEFDTKFNIRIPKTINSLDGQFNLTLASKSLSSQKNVVVSINDIPDDSNFLLSYGSNNIIFNLYKSYSNLNYSNQITKGEPNVININSKTPIGDFPIYIKLGNTDVAVGNYTGSITFLIKC